MSPRPEVADHFAAGPGSKSADSGRLRCWSRMACSATRKWIEDIRRRGARGDIGYSGRCASVPVPEHQEAPMKRCHFIGLDVHCQSTELAVVTQSGQLTK